MAARLLKTGGRKIPAPKIFLNIVIYKTKAGRGIFLKVIMKTCEYIPIK
jgi:hypothetical protein